MTKTRDLADLGGGFIQAGTGAVQRTVESKLQDVVSVKDFGAVGDGVTDDTAAIQAAINAAMQIGKPVSIPGPGPYLITSTLQVKITRNAAPTDSTPADDIHFTDLTPAWIIGYGMPTLKAGAAISAIMELIYDTTDLDVGPFYTRIEGIGFDGNNLATTGIKSNYSMHNSIERNRFWNLYRGIEYIGYGVGIIRGNVFRAVQGVYMSGGGGDTDISFNDFFAPGTAPSACIRLEWYGGNTKISSNIFTNEYGSTHTTYAIQLLGTTASGSQEIRDVKIALNEFAGFTTGVRADGKSAEKNVYRILITGNHTHPFGSYNTGQLLSAVSCKDFIVTNNFCNTLVFPAATNFAIELTQCDRILLSENNIANYSPTAVLFWHCTDCRVVGNSLYDTGKTGAGYSVIGINGTSSGNVFRGNILNQSSASFAQNGIVEGTGANSSNVLDNLFTQISTPHYKVGSNSLMRRVEFASATPSSSAYIQGDTVWNTSPTAGGTPGWICVTSGSPGVWKAMANLAV